MSGEQAGAAVEVLAQPEFGDEPGTVRDLLLGTWRGRFGLAVVGLFVFIAVFGKAIAPYDPDASSLDVLAPPSIHHLLGTTENGSDVLSQILVGARVSIVVGFAAAAISAILGSAVGLVGRLLRRLDRPRPRRARELVPRHPNAAADDRPGADPQPVADRADRGHRAHVVGRDGSDRAGAGADASRAGLRRARPGPRRRRRLHHPQAHPPEHAAADLRQHGADRRGGDPLRGGARRSWASATRRGSRGERCSRTRSSPGRPAPRRGGT